jgi:uncharacterized protein YdiU (UPF0061 family)
LACLFAARRGCALGQPQIYLDDLITSLVKENIDFTQFFQKMDTKNQEDKEYSAELLDTMLKE